MKILIPFIKLHFSSTEDNENCMQILVDIDVVINTGNMSYHKGVMLKGLYVVGEYTECGPNTVFDIFHY